MQGESEVKEISDQTRVTGSAWQASRDVAEVGAAVSVLHSVDVGPEQSRVLLRALVVATEILGQLLVVVEHHVRLLVPPDHRVQPQLLHEEHLVGKCLGSS